MKNKNQFITLEGIDCAGKSSVLNYIQSMNLSDVACLHQFSNSGVGNLIQDMLKNNNLLRLNNYYNTPVSEALLLMSEHFFRYKTEIEPLLNNEKTVIKDRFIDSIIAYTSAVIENNNSADYNYSKIVDWFSSILRIENSTLPDKTFILDVSLETALKRYYEKHGKYPEKDEKYILSRAAMNYKMAISLYPDALNPSRIRIINTENRTIKEIGDIIISSLPVVRMNNSNSDIPA